MPNEHILQGVWIIMVDDTASCATKISWNPKIFCTIMPVKVTHGKCKCLVGCQKMGKMMQTLDKNATPKKWFSTMWKYKENIFRAGHRGPVV